MFTHGVRSAVPVLALIVSYFLAERSEAQKDPLLDDVLDRLRESESSTMADIDYKIRSLFELKIEPPFDDAVVVGETTLHSVWQDDMFRVHRLEIQELAQQTQGRGEPFSEVVTFDGSEGRTLNGGAGNLMRFMPEVGYLRSLHGNVLNQPGFGASISAFLRAPESAGPLYTTLVGEKAMGGYQCYQVALTNYDGEQQRQILASEGKKTIVWDYFFRVDNLLPVGVVRSLVDQNGKRSDKLSEIMVVSWQEVEGREFPLHVKEQVFTPDGAIKQTRDSEYSIRSLSPDHDDSFFTMKWPLGTKVYELSGPGVVALKYTVGGDRTVVDIIETAFDRPSSEITETTITQSPHVPEINDDSSDDAVQSTIGPRQNFYLSAILIIAASVAVLGACILVMKRVRRP